jgi:hypothetical protein
MISVKFSSPVFKEGFLYGFQEKAQCSPLMLLSDTTWTDDNQQRFIRISY